MSDTPASDIPLVVESAVKRFGPVQALDGASLTVGRGELVGLLGPNGAGKTTLIRAIAGRLRLDSGRVSLFGRALTPEDPRAELGVVPQEIAVYPLLTATENLRAFGELYGVRGAALDERVSWALAWSDLADRADEPVKRYSGGMKRRLNIACSFVHQPSIVLLDEPTVGVDPQSRERIYEMLTSLRVSGVSIVLTTHHLEEAERRCERIVIIDKGRIVAAGDMRELVSRVLGAQRTLRLTLAAPLDERAALPADLVAEDGRRVVRTHVDDPRADVVRAMDAVGRLGAEVVDLELARASLQDVFIALTGRELRE
ncbi:MAG TPA: ABC transporter ATP-binding protein [Vicinamibacterales bacterium]|nr:ABC transporter ATP-binding protein [Vicinamibacterales bacterium]